MINGISVALFRTVQKDLADGYTRRPKITEVYYENVNVEYCIIARKRISETVSE